MTGPGASSTGISVPSSSGNSLQPSAPLRLRGSLRHFSPLFIGELPSTGAEQPGQGLKRKFQSPLHRGTPFNFLLDLRQTRLSLFQSPLHRGTPFNSFFNGQLFRCVFISVPSSSGNSLQHRANRAGAARGPHFSPLFIGELPSTQHSRSIANYGSAFQSPLHRGTPFNVPKGRRGDRRRGISVPSSSGNSLQPRRPSVSFVRLRHFSPLFIGELPSTHRVGQGHWYEAHFSPLFIGELPSTPASTMLRGDGCQFQSPLHRGTPFNY